MKECRIYYEKDSGTIEHCNVLMADNCKKIIKVSLVETEQDDKVIQVY